MSVPAKISLVTLGVSDLERSGAFYDALGWERVGDNEGVIFYRMAGSHLALFPLASLAEDAHSAPDRSRSETPSVTSEILAGTLTWVPTVGASR